MYNTSIYHQQRHIIMKHSILFLSVLIFCSVGISGALNAGPEEQTVYVIPVQDMVEPAMAAYIKRALKDAQIKKNTLIVFKMDTFGGRVDAALDIVDTISNIPMGQTVAYVEKRAISAGALIALSSSQLFMKNNTIIGDCAPIINTQDGQQMAGEKIQTVLRARFRALAKKNNYPLVLAESMVTIDMEVYEVIIDNEKTYMNKKMYNDLTDTEKKKIQSKKTIVAEGELLTMDDREAFDLGFSRKSVQNMEEMLLLLGYGSAQVITMDESWSESFVRFLQPFLPILMLLGIGALYMEMKAPGFGFPGFAGIACLSLVLFGQYLVGLANYTEVLILLIGILFLGIEVFVLPGFGVAGFTGLIVIGAGLVLSFQNFVIPDPALPWERALLMTNIARVFGVLLSGFFISVLMIRFVLPGLSKRVGGGPYLQTSLEAAHAGVMQDMGLTEKDTGVAHSFLRPSGKVMIKGKKIDAITRGEFVETGTPVVIEKIEHNRVIVKPLKSET